MRVAKPPTVKANVPPEAPVQSADVGNTPRPRRKRVKEVQGLRENLLNKMRNDLR